MFKSTEMLLLAKQNWKEITIIALLLLAMGKMRYDYSQLESAYEASLESMEEQIRGLQHIHDEELAARDKALESYRKSLELLEESYLEKQSELEDQMRWKKKIYIKDFTKDKNSMADAIIDTYGFEYVP